MATQKNPTNIRNLTKMEAFRAIEMMRPLNVTTSELMTVPTTDTELPLAFTLDACFADSIENYLVQNFKATTGTLPGLDFLHEYVDKVSMTDDFWDPVQMARFWKEAYMPDNKPVKDSNIAVYFEQYVSPSMQEWMTDLAWLLTLSQLVVLWSVRPDTAGKKLVVTAHPNDYDTLKKTVFKLQHFGPKDEEKLKQFVKLDNELFDIILKASEFALTLNICVFDFPF